MSFSLDKSVLLVTPQPYYEDRGTPIAISMVLRALTELGYTVDVLAFPLGVTTKTNGVRIIRCSNPLGIRSVPIGFSWRKAALDLFLTAKMNWLLGTRQYTCIHAVEEAALFAACLNGNDRPPMIYDMASALPEALEAEPLFRIPGMMHLVRSLESRALHRASHIVCSKGLGDYVTSRVNGATVTEWSFPGHNTTRDAGARSRIRKQLNIAGDTIVCAYTGSFAPYQGLDVVIRAIPRILETAPDTVFVLVGAEPAEAVPWHLSAQISDAIRIVPRQPRETIGAYLEAADILISPRSTGMNAPLKIFDYLSTPKLVLASDNDAHRTVAAHPRVHLFVHSPEGFAVAFGSLLKEGVSTTPSPTDSPDHGWPGFRDQVESVYQNAIMSA